MKGDAIQEHAHALRQVCDGESADAAATRRRILEVAHARARRRRRLVVLTAPMAAALVLSSAWAAVSGRLPRLVALLAESAPAPTDASHSARGDVGRNGLEQGNSQVASAPLPAPSVPAPSLTETSAPPVLREVHSPQARGSAVDASAYAEESMYEAAHRAHFVTRDPAAALRGWDEYLAEYPAGRFAPEARYNRALTLVRLGRIEEARAALAPFAEGAYGGYRRAEAREVLDALASTAR